MATLAENITQAISDFDDIQAAIIEKGVDIPSLTPTSAYGNKIRTIPSGGITPSDVNFYDYDGTLVAAWTIAEAQTATSLPVAPTHDRLVFQEWNWTLTQVKALTMPLDVGAIYTTASGKSEFDITLSALVSLSVTLRLYNNTSGAIINVDWGDGTSEDATTTTVGIKTFTHTYSGVGNYTIGVDSTGYYNPYGANATPFNMFNVTPCYICTDVRLGDRCQQITTCAFDRVYNLKTITIPTTVTSVSNYVFRYNYALRHVNIPSTLNIGTYGYAFYYCYVLNNVIVSSITTTLNNYFVGTNYVMNKVIIPSNIVTIAAYAYGDCYTVTEYILHRSTPPNLVNTTAFNNISFLCKIKVPPGSLAAYKAATNWAAFADYMEEWS